MNDTPVTVTVDAAKIIAVTTACLQRLNALFSPTARKGRDAAALDIMTGAMLGAQAAGGDPVFAAYLEKQVWVVSIRGEMWVREIHLKNGGPIV